MREIGGYIELEKYQGYLFHDEAYKLNSGRACLEYILINRKIKKIAMPYVMCDSVLEVCHKLDVKINYYHIDERFRPIYQNNDPEEWLYLMNYYGQLTRTEIENYIDDFKNVIVDQTHDYFSKAYDKVDNIYTCRKYLGVADGAFLYTDLEKNYNLESSLSYNQMEHILGRFEKSASEFYIKSVENNKRFKEETIKLMSLLTENMLRSFDYEFIHKRRNDNFNFLYEKLNKKNLLNIRKVDGAFSYPLMITDGKKIKKELIKRNIYVPTLWPNVLENNGLKEYEYNMVENLLPLPCDQRYDVEDMEYMVNTIEELIWSINE